MPVSAKEKQKSAPAPAAAEITEKKNDLSDLRSQIESLRKEMTVAEGARADAADQLKDAERAISLTQRNLHQLTEQRIRLQSTLKDLGAQSRELEGRLSSQQTQLEKFIYRQYLQGNPDSLRLLLNGDDPNQVARDLQYLAVIAHARQHLLDEIDSTLQQMRALSANTRYRAEQLTVVEAKQTEQHSKLLDQRAQHKAALEKISAKIAAQRREIGTLQRDEKRLSQLIERLAKIIAAQPAARKETAKNTSRASASKPSQTSELSNELTPQASPNGHFAQHKGTLRLPVKGAISNRFGATRQEGSTWKGLFIRTDTGTEVKAIAGGRVVFADWMRGFGNLLIVDHGDSYLSIYGNNDSLLKQVGDTVRGGDTIATAGNSGGNPESGLYFEIRYQGQPLDPLKWASIK